MRVFAPGPLACQADALAHLGRVPGRARPPSNHDYCLALQSVSAQPRRGTLCEPFGISRSEGVATERHRWEVEDCRVKCRGSGNMTPSRILHSAAAAIDPHSAAVTKSAIMVKPPRGLRIGPLLNAGAGLGRRIYRGRTPFRSPMLVSRSFEQYKKDGKNI